MNAQPADRKMPITLEVVDPTGAAAIFNAERFARSLERKGLDQNLAGAYVEAFGELLTNNNVQAITTNDLSVIASEVVSDAKKNAALLDSKFKFESIKNNAHLITIFQKFLV